MKPTNWKAVVPGTKVLWRNSKDSEYEVAVFGGAASNGTFAGAFYWSVVTVSGCLIRAVGARVAENGEWHVDPHYLKLAVVENSKPKDKHVFVVTDEYKRVWHLPMQAVFDDWLECEADYRNLKPAEVLTLIKEGKAEYDIETWMSEQMYADVLKRKATLVKDLTDKQKIALAEKIMTPQHNDKIVDERKIKWPSKAAFKSFDKLLKGK